MDLIDALPPGLYEAVFVPKTSLGSYMRNCQRRLRRPLEAWP